MLAVDGVRNLIPIILRIHEIPPLQDDPSAAPRFSGALRVPATEENFILFDNEKHKFRILHADSTSCSRFLGLVGEQLEEEDHPIGDFVPKLKVASEDDGTGITVGNGYGGSMRKQSSVDVLDQQTMQNQEFLNERCSQSEHVVTHVEQTATKGLEKVLARISKFPVRGYGDVYLFAWKYQNKTKRRRASISLHNSGEERTGSVDFSQGLCPVLSSDKASSSSGNSTHPRHVSYPSSDTPIDERCTQLLPNYDDSINTNRSQGVTSDPKQSQETKVFSGASVGNEIVQSKRSECPQKSAEAISAPRSVQYSQGRSSTGTSTSVKQFLHHVKDNGITGVKPILNKTRILLIISLGVFVVYAAVGWSEIDRITNDSVAFLDSTNAANAELISYLGVISSLVFAHLPNSRFPGMAGGLLSSWKDLDDQINRYFAASDISAVYAEKLGGITGIEELKTKHEVIHRFSGAKQALSTKEIREFVRARLRQLVKESNITDFIPGDTPRHALILFDNKSPVVEAMNSSTLKRMEQFRNTTDNYVRNTEVTLVVVLCVTIVTLAFFLIRFLLHLHANKQDILKTFLLLPLSEIKSQRSDAMKSLKEQLQRTRNTDFVEDDDSTAEHNSLDDFEPEIETECEKPQDLLIQLVDNKIDKQREQTQKSPSATPAGSPLLSPSNKRNVNVQSRRNSQLQDFRNHKNPKKVFAHSLVKVISPLLFMIGWAFSVFVIVGSMFDILRQKAVHVEVAGFAAGGWIEYQQQLALLSLRMPFPDTYIGNASRNQLTEFRQHFLDERNLMVQRLSLLADGHNQHGKDTGISDGNACFWLPDELSSDCRTTSLRFGLRRYTRDYINIGLNIMSKLAPISDDNETAMDKLAYDEKLQNMFRSLHATTTPLTEKAAFVYCTQRIKNAEDTIGRAKVSVQIVTVICVIGFAICLVMITMPTMERAGATLNSAFQLLALLPESLLQSHRTLRHQVHRLIHSLAAEEKSEDAMLLLALQNREMDTR